MLTEPIQDGGAEDLLLENDHLNARVKILEARVAITDDLESQVKALQVQLEEANRTKAKIQAILTQENSILKQQLTESHFKRSQLQGELKGATQYLTELEERVYDANSKALDLLK